MTEIIIRIPGQPQGKGRHRSFVRNGHVGHYTPEKTRTYEGLIASHGMDAMGDLPPFEVPITMDLIALIEVPKSWPAWKVEMALRGEIAPTVKPDSDNIKKALNDGLNGIVWRDDCYVTLGSYSKQYAPVPAVCVKIRPTGQFPAQIKIRPIRG